MKINSVIDICVVQALAFQRHQLQFVRAGFVVLQMVTVEQVVIELLLIGRRRHLCYIFYNVRRRVIGSLKGAFCIDQPEYRCVI